MDGEGWGCHATIWAMGKLTPTQRMLILKAIADPRRMEIVERLRAQEQCTACSDLREVLPISAATLSHHLKELETAGLIAIAREGKYARLSFQRELWAAFLGDLGQI